MMRSGTSLSFTVRRFLVAMVLVVAGTLFFLGLAATLGLPGEDGANEPPAALAEGDRFAR